MIALQAGQPHYRVLVADDEESNCRLLSRVLTPVGFHVRRASNGKEAIKEFESWRPHLILMDIRMPVMDGYEAIRRIRAADGGAEVKIIAVTASVFEEKRDEVLDTGADDFLSKPFHITELLEKIRVVLGAEYVYEEKISPVAQ